MRLDLSFVRRRRLIGAGLLLLGCLPLTLAGCSEPDPIQEYVVRKPATAGSLWFFKLMGPADAVTNAATPLREFVASVRFDERSGRPTWTLPAGWTEEEAQNSVRYKTIKLPGEPALEIAVTQISGKVPLPPEEERIQFNMLREQVGLKPVEPAAAGEPGSATGAEDISLDGLTARLFDFTGETTRFGATRLLTAMVAVPTPPQTGASGSTGELPFTYQAPAEWQDAPPTQFSVVSMAASNGEETASMTITPAMGGILANINRWRTQAELAPIDEAQLPEMMQPIEAGELTILYAEVMGEKRAILGGVVPLEAGTWFVKLDGPPQVVKDEQERFRQFLASFRAAK
jgi:hypothetical protein